MTAAEKRSERVFLAIEAMLNHRHPRQDNKAIVDTLRSRFGSAHAMLQAEPFLLERSGLHPHDALMISQLPSLVRLFEQDSFKKRPYLARLNLASEYLVAQFRNLRVERFYMICLNSQGLLKERVFLQEGTSDGALFSLRHLLTQVVRVSPRAIILSHNHPGGTKQPSQPDLDCTLQALRALSTLGIPLLDHIVVANRHAVSIRENALVPNVLWMKQNPEDSFLRNWLRDDKDPAINRVTLP